MDDACTAQHAVSAWLPWRASRQPMSSICQQPSTNLCCTFLQNAQLTAERKLLQSVVCEWLRTPLHMCMMHSHHPQQPSTPVISLPNIPATARTVLQFPPRASLSKLVSFDCLKGTCASFLLRAFTVCSRKVRDLLMALASCAAAS